MKTLRIKYENLEVTGTEFTYQLVLVDRDMISSRKNNYGFQYAGIIPLQAERVDLGDTITIKGKINIVDVTKSGIEDKVATVNLRLEAEHQSSYLQATPYGYGEYERMTDGYDFEENLIVDLKRPYIFNKNEMYLKARISELTKEDLKNYSKDELAFLRNELFARHGHTFKTDKMKEYFEKQMWYKPYFEDATPFLNYLEKKNAKFIKTMES